MSFQTIQFKIENRVAWLVMNRPEMKNALNAEMREEMFLALAGVGRAGYVRKRPWLPAATCWGLGALSALAALLR